MPSLRFLRMLFGDAPDVDPGALFFHRALVEDVDGPAVLIGEQAGAPLAEVYGKILLPAVAPARAEREGGGLDVEEERRVYWVVRTALAGVVAARPTGRRTGSRWGCSTTSWRRPEANWWPRRRVECGRDVP